MLTIMQNKKGATFLDVLVALLVTLVLSGMLITTSRFMGSQRADVREMTQFDQTVHNTIVSAYNTEDWSRLEDRNMLTTNGHVFIEYDYPAETILSNRYQTERMQLTFSRYRDDRLVQSHTHAIERSVINHE